MMDDLAGDIEQSAADCGGVSCHGNDTLTCILFEGFQEEEGRQHHIVMGSVHAELFEGKLLRGKILQCSVYKLIVPPVMVTFDE